VRCRRQCAVYPFERLRRGPSRLLSSFLTIGSISWRLPQIQLYERLKRGRSIQKRQAGLPKDREGNLRRFSRRASARIPRRPREAQRSIRYADARVPRRSKIQPKRVEHPLASECGSSPTERKCRGERWHTSRPFYRRNTQARLSVLRTKRWPERHACSTLLILLKFCVAKPPGHAPTSTAGAARAEELLEIAPVRRDQGTES
jgi:hypothetical protein